MRSFLASLLILALPAAAGAWGEKGHLLINRLAITAAGPQLPEFMDAARDQLIYNSYEPDRWRDEVNTPMAIAQAPDHFFDSEYWGAISTIDPDRYAFMEKVAAKKVELIKIGYLPYAVLETYGRLRNAFRYWRAAKTPQDREAARMNAIVYAGILGHYVGDGSNPLHLTIHFNGWDDKTSNPKNFTKDRGLHSRYETEYVNRALDIAKVTPQVKGPQRLPDVFESVKLYLAHSFSEVDRLYELEKTGAFNPDKPQPAATEFIAADLARAATMLASLWYTAWIESAESPATPAAPVPTKKG
jgi:hypothetical protein